MRNILKIYHLKDEALMDLYKRLDKDLRPMPKKPDGSIDPYGLGLEDNDVDALDMPTLAVCIRSNMTKVRPNYWDD